MSRTTVDYGIDLGTTNSSIAVLNGMNVEVIKNNKSMDYTPSAVYINKDSRIYVGDRAKERIESDPDNAYCEFKLRMGSDKKYKFSSSGVIKKPEELSAEVLKSLKADVLKRKGEDIKAAVITVPAAFDFAQCEATKKAAQLAGIEQCLLIQEPVAAALTYGLQNDTDRVYWLVYDFGGGTFDAALVNTRDGMINVVNHDGDNLLGGNNIDWDIIEQLIIPELTDEYCLTDFHRGNPKWRGAIAKLKTEIKKAKISLSSDEKIEVFIESLCKDDDGEPVDFEYTLYRSDIEALAEPYIIRSINICKKVLEEKHLKPSDIEKIILVGGSTLMPYLRQRLAEELNIKLEFSKDPLTVMAQGAAIFAGSQRLE